MGGTLGACQAELVYLLVKTTEHPRFGSLSGLAMARSLFFSYETARHAGVFEEAFATSPRHDSV